MTTFSKDKNGYKTEEVDSYIKKMELEYQHEIEEKRERINELKIN